MTVKKLLDDIECRKFVMTQSRIIPKAISMNAKTKEKIVIDSNFKNGTVYGLDIFIDDKLADDEFRLLRK